MKYYKRANIYKASNVSFNPETKTAYSYDWWQFVKEIDGKIVFNNYPYSISTRRHQSKIQDILNELGIKVDIWVDVPEGLQQPDALLKAADYYRNKNEVLKSQIVKKGSKLKKNQERQAQIVRNNDMITELKLLNKPNIINNNDMIKPELTKPEPVTMGKLSCIHGGKEESEGVRLIRQNIKTSTDRKKRQDQYKKENNNKAFRDNNIRPKR